MARAAVVQFTRDIARNMYPDNSFYKNSIDDSQFIQGSKVVWGVSGAKPGINQDPQVFPLTIKEIGDTSAEYPLQLLATDPTRIGDLEAMIVNYGMRENAILEHREALQERFANNIAYKWAPTLSARIIRTTGGATGTGPAGSTGGRKLALYNDFVNCQTAMDEMDVPLDGRCVAIPASMRGDVMKISEFKDYDKLGVGGVIANGAIGRILGFDVFIRSSVVRYSQAGTPVPKSPITSVASTDNHACLFWQKSFVRRAEGAPKTYINADQAVLLGTALNFSLYGGGEQRRPDTEEGVVVLVQDQ